MTFDTPDFAATMGETQNNTQEQAVEHSPKVSVRFSAKLYAACKVKAGKLSIGKWLRALAEDATGVKSEMVRGLATLGKRKRRQISRAGGLKKAANAAEREQSEK